MCQIALVDSHLERSCPINKIITIRVDLAKFAFQVHNVGTLGRALFRRQLRRSQFLLFFERLPGNLAGMEVCTTPHHWPREFCAKIARNKIENRNFTVSIVS